MLMHVRAYMRASTDQQDATRAKDSLKAFAKERGLKIAATYVENESGAKLARPELFRLLSDSDPGDILLIEQVDRLSRLTEKDWERLKREIKDRGVRIIALDLPTSHGMMTKDSDGFTGWVLEAINGMLLDMLAAIARKDYDDRRRRQAEGIARERARDAEREPSERAYRGRPENTERNNAIIKMLRKGQSWSTIVEATGASRATLAKLAKRAQLPTG